MRIAWFVVTGLGLIGWVGCGDSSGGDLFNAGPGGSPSTSSSATPGRPIRNQRGRRLDNRLDGRVR